MPMLVPEMTTPVHAEAIAGAFASDFRPWSRSSSAHVSIDPNVVIEVAASPTPHYKDGIFPGSVANAYYGNVQVQASIQDGQLVSVKVLQFPNDRNTSRYINSQAIPILQQEAIQSQGGQVDVVSGATLTSEAFIQSLASALSQAGGDGTHRQFGCLRRVAELTELGPHPTASVDELAGGQP